MSSEHEASALHQVVEHLVATFPAVDPMTVRAVVDEVHGTFDGPVRDYVPLLVQRVSTDRLRAMASVPAQSVSPARRSVVSA